MPFICYRRACGAKRQTPKAARLSSDMKGHCVLSRVAAGIVCAIYCLLCCIGRTSQATRPLVHLVATLCGILLCCFFKTLRDGFSHSDFFNFSGSGCVQCWWNQADQASCASHAQISTCYWLQRLFSGMFSLTVTFLQKQLSRQNRKYNVETQHFCCFLRVKTKPRTRSKICWQQQAPKCAAVMCLRKPVPSCSFQPEKEAKGVAAPRTPCMLLASLRAVTPKQMAVTEKVALIYTSHTRVHLYIFLSICKCKNIKYGHMHPSVQTGLKSTCPWNHSPCFAEECNAMDQCRNCLPGHGCWSIDTWTGYGVSSYGSSAKLLGYGYGPAMSSKATQWLMVRNTWFIGGQ